MPWRPDVGDRELALHVADGRLDRSRLGLGKGR
jgi:hypothetical protein